VGWNIVRHDDNLLIAARMGQVSSPQLMLRKTKLSREGSLQVSDSHSQKTSEIQPSAASSIKFSVKSNYFSPATFASLKEKTKTLKKKRKKPSLMVVRKVEQPRTRIRKLQVYRFRAFVSRNTQNSLRVQKTILRLGSFFLAQNNIYWRKSFPQNNTQRGRPLSSRPLQK
jgi:hypothetical protein